MVLNTDHSWKRGCTARGSFPYENSAVSKPGIYRRSEIWKLVEKDYWPYSVAAA